ncbi:MAG: methylmalonyl-CoA mutase, partial [Myxococcales bacterium]|nr:methylmalonyl-CoA mutase [Myxococcales bacterium]
GELPIIGVNTFLAPDADDFDAKVGDLQLTRAGQEEKQQQLDNLATFQTSHQDESERALDSLKAVALSGGNIFAELMRTVRVASLGQISGALYDVGGRYRRNM